MPLLPLLALLVAPASASPWAEAMATGDCAAVLVALPSPATDPERLAAARCALRAGDPTRAEALAGSITGALAPYAALTRADALLALKRPADAAAALQGVHLSGAADELLRGRTQLAAGDAAGASTTLAALTSGPLAADAGYWLGQAKEAAGDAKGAIAAYTAVWTGHPSSTASLRAEERLTALGVALTDVSTDAARDATLARAKKLLDLSLADRAIPLLDAVDKVRPFATSGEQRFMADALFSAKQYARAVDWYGRSGAPATSPVAAFQEALATARAGDYPAAAAKYEVLVRRFPTSSQADEASFKPPYMDYDAGRYEQAVAGFTAYLSARPTGKFAADARWLRAWSHYKLGHKVEAEAGFTEVAAADPTGSLAAAATYWRAELTGDAAGMARVRSAFPTTAYAWFAERQAPGAPPPSAPAEVQAPAIPASHLAARPNLRTAVELLDAGLPELARPLLAGELEAAKASESTRLGVAYALVRAEDYQGAKKLAAPYCGKASAREVCLPRPYPHTVTALAREAGFDPLLPYAIMTAESALNPSVTSPAGARGLMQLMPTLATKLADGRIPGFAEDDLYRAGVNARLGTIELAELHRRLDPLGIQPSLPLVIAAYNGGADAVERWVDSYPVAPTAARFAEDISYTETRRYVRRVLGYLQEYRRAYGS